MATYPVIDKVQGFLESWKNRTLSIEDREWQQYRLVEEKHLALYGEIRYWQKDWADAHKRFLNFALERIRD